MSAVATQFDTPTVIQCDPEIMHGMPCFQGTRVPIKTLFDHIDTEGSLETALHEFYEGFPHITKSQVTDVLKQEEQARQIMQKYEQKNNF